ncbi:nuclear transport factor 2 family protein [Pseudomonas sp. BN515]|uniref:nuclear transport factor 2 family protein n=1 Tax=Pseudomonas sp. BN515 TaxID=2567892 RepID=UPI002456678A|nr:nuclear transport factor 2 family protein [Pseudomonas sp. BN515]MDH4874430.1 hypothetical protein [Pseudomonas sp. BN515]
MSDSLNKQLALDYLARIETGDLPGALSLTSDDAVFWLPNTGEMNKDGFAAFLAQVIPVIRTMRFTIEGVTEQGERVAVQLSGNAQLSNGRNYINHYHFLFIAQDGLLRQVREYTDTAPAMAAFAP